MKTMMAFLLLGLLLDPLAAGCRDRVYVQPPAPPNPLVAVVDSSTSLINKQLAFELTAKALAYYTELGDLFTEIGCAFFGSYHAALSNIAYGIQSYADYVVPRALRYGGQS